MIFIGEAAFMGTSLELSSRDAPWSLAIRGIDGNNDPLFMEYHGKPTTAGDIMAFLPQWRSLVWRQIPDTMFSTSVSRATNTMYEIELTATRNSPLSHEDIVMAFEAFMDPSG